MVKRFALLSLLVHDGWLLLSTKRLFIVDLSDYRREYTKDTLDEADLPENPHDLFTLWFEQAEQAQLPDANAMVLATVDSQQRPLQRVVLLKDYDAHSLTFYTNLTSTKAHHIAQNNNVSAHFPWIALERQVIFCGRARPLDEQAATRYFQSRPRESQLSAWASHQSQPVASRQALDEAYTRCQEQFKDKDIPKPDFWGGYQIDFNRVEFWQGGSRRLHDRFLYTKNEQGWVCSRIAP